ncbi:YscO family type III secretion system apparatus protein [Phyllobacterium salinisoli]|nr:YscO family type III secretion system apparatus protein [Phyllobacterium salinisoli]
MTDTGRIVEIRSRRLGRARQELAETRAEFTRAGSQVVAAQQMIGDFELATHALETELLTSILYKPASIQTLLMIEEKLKKTERQARELAQRLADAKEALNTAGEAAEAAVATTASSERRLIKSHHLFDEARLAELLEANKRDDAELDDFGHTGPFYHAD